MRLNMFSDGYVPIQINCCLDPPFWAFSVLLAPGLDGGPLTESSELEPSRKVKRRADINSCVSFFRSFSASPNFLFITIFICRILSCSKRKICYEKYISLPHKFYFNYVIFLPALCFKKRIFLQTSS